MKYVLTVWVVLLLAGVPAGRAADDNPFTVDCFPGWGGRYRPMEWAPLEITISSTLTEPFAGTLHVACAQDNLNTLHVSRPFVLTPQMPTRLSLVTRLAYNAEGIEVRLADQDGRTQWREELTLWDYTGDNRLLVPVNQEDLFIGLIGRRGFGLMRLPTIGRSQWQVKEQDRMGKVVVEEKLYNMVPWDWTGFNCLDILILYDPDWAQLRAEQLQALTEWIYNGGRALIILGRHPFPVNSALGQHLPVTIGALREVVPDRDWLTDRGLEPPSDAPVTSYPLTPRPSASLITPPPASGPRLEAVGNLGFGRIGILGLDPAVFTDTSASGTGRFWQRTLQSVLQPDPAAGTGRKTPAWPTELLGPGTAPGRSLVIVDSQADAPKPPQGRYDLMGSQQGMRVVLDYLYGIEQLRPLHIAWVIGLLLLLALLLGPVDYFVLKRLDRQPLTWMTSLGWIVCFTVGAYYGVQALRAGDLQVRTVSVVDAVQGLDQACSTYVSGIFAPRSADYCFEQTTPRQWWSGISPQQDFLYGHQGTGIGRQVYCVQQDGANQPYSIPVNIWTMQSLQMETVADTLPVNARVTCTGDAVDLFLDNLSGQRILGGCLLLSDGRAVTFGPVERGRSLERTARPQTFKPWSRDHGPEQRWLAFSQAVDITGARRRSGVIADYLRQGAALLCMEFDEAPTPFTLAQPSCKTHHIRYGRLVVFPQTL